jgi:hypothetical protein
LDTFACPSTSAPPQFVANVRAKLAGESAQVIRHFTPEYLLQKLDFLMRYPRHLAYELAELHRLQIFSATNGEDVAEDIRSILRDDEPELRTDLYRKFWHGAYERLDAVESWWLSRRLVFVRAEHRGDAPPQKHYFLTPAAADIAERLRNVIAHALWYAARAKLLHRYFGALSAAAIKSLQYDLPGYREAQLGAPIPDVPDELLHAAFRRSFRCELWSPR